MIDYDFPKRFEELDGWFRSAYQEKILSSVAGTPLRVACRNPAGSQACLVVVSGRSEYIEKYQELARELSTRKLSVWLYDHCGQGRSGRLLSDPQKGHIDSFDTYIADLDQVIEMAAAESGNIPVFLLSHSMGGTISTLYASRHNGRIKRLVLASPMFGIQTGVFLPDFVTEMLVKAACLAGLGERYALTTGPYNFDRRFEDNVLSSDRYRFCYNRFLAEQLDFAPIGGPTFGWMNEAFKAVKTLKRSIARTRCPILALTAAQDQVIKAADVARSALRLPHLSYHEYPSRGHELFMERDEIRDDVLERVGEFLATEP